jgi:hypothetical protein
MQIAAGISARLRTEAFGKLSPDQTTHSRSPLFTAA